MLTSFEKHGFLIERKFYQRRSGGMNTVKKQKKKITKKVSVITA